MTVTLTVVLDQLADPADADLATASREIARALVRTAPAGCEVAGLAPAGPGTPGIGELVPGLSGLTRVALPASAVRQAWQLGVSPRPSGLVHAPAAVAPLGRHDRVNGGDQVVVTLWDASAWMPGGTALSAAPGDVAQRESRPGALAALKHASSGAWAKAVLARWERHADAVVVPTHAMGEWFASRTRLGERVRVIGGAAPEGFAVPTDAAGRLRTLGLRPGSVVVTGAAAAGDSLGALAAAVGGSFIVDRGGDGEPSAADHAIVDLARLDDLDRAAVLGTARAVVALSPAPTFPWRVVEALTLGVPVVAAASDVHHEIIAEAGLVVGSADVADAAAQVLHSGETRERFALRSADRGRAYSWRDHAERVWALHADL